MRSVRLDEIKKFNQELDEKKKNKKKINKKKKK
jgi:hypothetical protein